MGERGDRSERVEFQRKRPASSVPRQRPMRRVYAIETTMIDGFEFRAQSTLAQGRGKWKQEKSVAVSSSSTIASRPAVRILPPLDPADTPTRAGSRTGKADGSGGRPNRRTLLSSSTGGIAIGGSDAVSCVPGAGSGSIAPSLSDDMTVERDAEAFLEAVRVALLQDNQPEKQVQFMDVMMAFQGNMCVSRNAVPSASSLAHPTCHTAAPHEQ